MLSTEWYNGYDDLKDVYAIRREVFVDELSEMSKTSDPLDKSAMHLVIYDDGEPAATGMAAISNDEFILCRIAVIEKYRRQRYGDFLVRLLIRRCFDSGASEQFVYVAEAKKAYFERFGFSSLKQALPETGLIKMVRYGDVSGGCHS